jgi:hypothetical protein
MGLKMAKFKVGEVVYDVAWKVVGVAMEFK